MNGNLSAEMRDKILDLLKQNNLNETAKLFLQETDQPFFSDISIHNSNRIDVYSKLLLLVDNSLDKYKAEFFNLLYPLFIHMFIELLYEGHLEEGRNFFKKFANYHILHEEDLKQIRPITTKQQADSNDIVNWFRFNKYTIQLSHETLAYIKYHLTKNNLHDVINKMEAVLDIEVSDDPPRSKPQVDQSTGSLEGEAKRYVNRTKIFCGLLKESDLVVSLGPSGHNVPSNEIPEEEANMTGEGKLLKKKAKRENFLLKRSKADPLGPPLNRIPLPELKESDKMLKILMAQESLKRYKITPNNLPSVCCYTMLNAKYSVTTAIISDDSSILVVGYSDGLIKIFSLTPQKLKIMKPATDLNKLDIHEEDVLNRIMDEKDLADCRTMMGHTESITGLAMSHDKLYVISSSEDATVKLWSLLVYKNIVTFKGHVLPVWDVKIGPYGYYFASCGADKTIRLWAMDQAQCLRIFVGHHSDVDVIAFHPNSNYIGSGSCDRTIRVWDLLNGACVRIFTGHKTPILALTFSLNGRHLISASKDGSINVWDLPQAHLITVLNYHTAPVYNLCFDRDGVCLTSGGADCDMAFWDYKRISETNELSSLYTPHGANINEQTTQDDKHKKKHLDHRSKPVHDSNTTTQLSNKASGQENYFLQSFRTKQSIIIYIHYTWRNLGLIITEFCPPPDK